jgi:beta-lactam-binding protein with PASTA domain
MDIRKQAIYTVLGAGMVLFTLSFSGCPGIFLAKAEIIGRPSEEVVALLTDNNMTSKMLYECSDTIPKGSVIRTIPDAATLENELEIYSLIDCRCDEGPPVEIYVSTGLCGKVPNIIGDTEESAFGKIVAAGLTPHKAGEQCSDTVSTGFIISQNPAAGTNIQDSMSPVSFVVSTGPCPIAVPNVVGFSEVSAISAIETAGFKAGVITYECSDTVIAGVVISQNPMGGLYADNGSAVNLLVSTGPCGGKVPVPSVVSFTQEVAESKLESEGFTNIAVSVACSDTVEQGSVISQNPAGGTLATTDTTVEITVSTGPCAGQVTVPDIVGLTQTEGTAAITNAGLTIGQTTEQCSDTVASGNIISQNPAAGVLVNPSATVDVVISIGDCTVTVSVPDLSGQTQPAATEQLSNLGLQLGTATYEHNETILEGLVIGQTPAPGTQVESNSSVDLTVSMGPTDPDIRMIMLPGGIPLPMVWCPGGTFNMGSDNFFDGAYPLHEVQLTKGYWLSKFELTEEQWKSISNENPFGEELNNPKHPMVNLTWNDAQSFLLTLNDTTGKSFRLPTEAEWEKACRAGTTTRFYWGDDGDLSMIDQYAWHYGNTGSIGDSGFKDVGQKLPNALNIYDMVGNIQEWCQDWGSDYPRDGITLIDPTGPETGIGKIYRGGSAYSMNPENDMQSFSRRSTYLDDPMCGIRLCHSEGLTE